MFRRSPATPSDSDPAVGTTSTEVTENGRPASKGRPTPSRKEAEAAAKLRAKPPRTRKEQAAAERKARQANSQLLRDALKTGDDRHLPARDRGPVRRFVRDFIDVRFSFIELLMPMMIVVLVLGMTGNQNLADTGTLILMGTLVLVIIDAVFMRRKLGKELKARFPDAPTRGITYYAVMRAMQMRFMRLPKAQKKIGQELDRNYR